MKKIGLLLGLLCWVGMGIAQEPAEKPTTNESKFRQLRQELPTPNVYRNASGAPGQSYYQNRADYQMDIRLDDDKQQVYGTETITYHNESPDALEYLWVQLDQNMRAKDSDTYKSATSVLDESVSFGLLQRQLNQINFDGGFKIDYVQDANGQGLPYYINRTMMRVDLPTPLEPGKSTSLNIKWWYNVNELGKIGGRSGFEYFPEDDNYLYCIAQFYPRMCVYNDIEGWQNKQFLGRGEFTLPFGDYEVRLTVPADHVVASTGTLQNPKEVLSKEIRDRLVEAGNSETPVLIVSQEEAVENEKEKATDTKTWEFHAENVRDFGWASSRKFVWDAQGVKMGDRIVMAMSFYPKEGNPLWGKYSTPAVAHTLEVYSKYTFDYPYEVAISVHTKDLGGMEYPMICFNGYRPEPDGTYSSRAKYGLISVVIHEVGHNYFPMIVNSDERQWTWMDEGLNSFLQYLSEVEWERDYPSRRGPAYKMIDYMTSAQQMPIMTNSESIYQFGNNAYGKPATALNVLRETILGREAFDYAFKRYAQRWMFKHPQPADFFRTMEDASGTDLDWFWRGWFYTTEHVDISLDEVKWLQINTQDPEVEKPLANSQAEAQDMYISDQRNKQAVEKTVVERNPDLADFYTKLDKKAVSDLDRLNYDYYLRNLDEEERAILANNSQFYQMTFSNKGGVVMPIILKFTYTDGTEEIKRIPAEIWRRNSETVNKVFMLEKELAMIQVDPYRETADADEGNNFWPARQQPTRFELYKRSRGGQPNRMQIEERIKEIKQESQGGQNR